MEYIVRFRLFILVEVLLTVAGGAVLAQQQTLITLPPVTHFAVGERATLDAEITCTEGNCSAFEIMLTYDPAIIQVESISLGDYLGANTIIPKRSIENGHITLVAAAMGIPPQQTGILFNLVVIGVSEGTTYILPESWSVGDLRAVPASVTSAQIIVAGAALPTAASLPMDVTAAAEMQATQAAVATERSQNVYSTLTPTRMTATTNSSVQHPNLLDVLENDPDQRFTILLSAIQASGLEPILSGGGPYTLLAPTDAAFTETLRGYNITPTQLLANPSSVTQIIRYHIIPGRYLFRNLTSGPSLNTLLNQTVTFNLSHGIFTVQGAIVSDVDNIAANGVIHVVDSVTIPPVAAPLLQAGG